MARKEATKVRGVYAAKPPCLGSNPIAASKKHHARKTLAAGLFRFPDTQGTRGAAGPDYA